MGVLTREHGVRNRQMLLEIRVPKGEVRVLSSFHCGSNKGITGVWKDKGRK